MDLLAVDGTLAPGRLHRRGVRDPAHVDGGEAGVVDEPATMRLASSSSPHRNMTTRSGPVRPAASAWKPEVSVLKAFV